MPIKIALAGNPNSGKTTLFNALTGANQFVGNWPGVTVEKKEGKLKGRADVTIVDLPGIYSLPPTPWKRLSRAISCWASRPTPFSTSSTVRISSATCTSRPSSWSSASRWCLPST